VRSSRLLLQSSTAVAVLAAGFAGIGIMSVATGLALMLGAYFGSSVVVLVLVGGSDLAGAFVAARRWAGCSSRVRRANSGNSGASSSASR